MADTKSSTVTMVDAPPSYIASAEQMTMFFDGKKKSRSIKKMAIIAVSGILIVAIILTAILVGMNMFTKAQKDLVQMKIKVDEKTTEEVIGNPNTNIVQLHVHNDKYEAWFVDDFNRDIRLVKIMTNERTGCYIVPLNRSMAMNPSQINSSSEFIVLPKNATRVVMTYKASDIPIRDTTFLSETASDTCNGIPVFWLEPQRDSSTVTEVAIRGREKREIFTLITFLLTLFSTFVTVAVATK